jgi:hypothetical protein
VDALPGFCARSLEHPPETVSGAAIHIVIVYQTLGIRWGSIAVLCR